MPSYSWCLARKEGRKGLKGGKGERKRKRERKPHM